jgi:thioredoxin-related protein
MFQKLTRLMAMAGIALFVASFAAAEGDGWIVDFEKAKETAAKEKKDILMDFTGSDWCGYCIKLHDEVFTKDEFKNEAPKSFVLLKLDFPKDASKQTKEEIVQNKKLNERFKVSGYPTILLADELGRPYARLVGYDDTPADAYMKQLLEMKKERVKRDELLNKAAKAEGVEKAKYLDQAVSLLDAELATSVFEKEIEQIIALDKDDSAQLKSKYENMAKLEKVKKRIEDIVAANQNDPKACIGAIDKLYDELKPTGVVAVEVLYCRAFMKFKNKDMEGSRADLDAALKADPNSPRAEEIKGIIQQVFEKKEEGKDESKNEGNEDKKEESKEESK